MSKISSHPQPKLSLCIVVPAYNEEHYLENCLEAIAAQAEPPDQVVVVDNNSTDRTVEIARRYPFVTLIHEKRQGIVFARNAGFDLAATDIIGRIDADSVIASDWVASAKRALSDTSVSAVTGKCYFYDAPLRHLMSAVQAFGYQHFQRWLSGGVEMLWGSNMAIRRSAWLDVRADSEPPVELDEDIMLAFRLHKGGYRIIRDKRLLADVSIRRGSLRPREFYEYIKSWPRDYAANGMHVRSALIWASIPLCVLIVSFAGLARRLFGAGLHASKRP